MYGVQSGPLSKIISAMQAWKFFKKGCEAFSALVLESKRGKVKLEDIPVVKEFSDVFPKDLSGFLPKREVDLSIEILPGTTPISMAPYRMAPTELKELKIQL